MKPTVQSSMPERSPLKTGIIVFAIVEAIGIAFLIYYLVNQ